VPKPSLQAAANALTEKTHADILKEFGEVTMEKITDLNKNVKLRVAEAKRAETSWENLLEKAFLIEDILENRNSVDYTIRSTFWAERSGFFGRTLDKLSDLIYIILDITKHLPSSSFKAWFWFVKLKNILKVFLSIIFAAFSIIVVVSEVTLFINIDFSGFGSLLKNNTSFFETQVSSLLSIFLA
jgi:hypothetical protein